MSEKAPAFQFYPKDWLSDARVRAMGREARGVYIDLLSLYWNEDGLPSDTAELARVAMVPQRTFDRLWPLIAPCFEVVETSLRSRRLDREKAKQAEYRNAQRLKGQKSAKSRVSAKPEQPRLESGSPPVEFRLEPKPNSPFPSPFPSASSTEQDTPSSSAERTDADAAREELRQALADLRKRLPELAVGSDQTILAAAPFHTSSGGICRIATCTNPGLMRATASKVRAYGKPKPSNGAPSWDRGDQAEADLTDQAIAWVDANWPADSRPETRADLEGLLAALDPPASLNGPILVHLLFGRYPDLRSAPLAPAGTRPERKGQTAVTVSKRPTACPECGVEIVEEQPGSYRCADSDGLGCAWRAIVENQPAEQSA